MLCSVSRCTPGRIELDDEQRGDVATRADRAPTTIAKSATQPSGTGNLAPLNAPSTQRVCTPSDAASGAMPSASASVPIFSPAASDGSHACFASSSPACRIASAAR